MVLDVNQVYEHAYVRPILVSQCVYQKLWLVLIKGPRDAIEKFTFLIYANHQPRNVTAKIITNYAIKLYLLLFLYLNLDSYVVL